MAKIIQNLRYRYQKNLEFFQKKIPHLYEIAHIQGKRNVELILNGNYINLSINGKIIYPANKDPKELAQIQTEQFLQNPVIIAHPPLFFPDGADREALNHLYIADIYRLAETHGLQKVLEHDQKIIPFLVTFGLGLGYHLEYLLKQTEVKYLVILEEDIELLKATFYTLDWKKIIQYFSQPGKDIFIFVNDNPQILYQDVYRAYERSHPMFAFYSYAWTLIKSPIFEQVIKLIKNDLFLITRGWGFFDDEFLSLLQSLRNIKRKTPVFIGKKPVSEKTLAIIIGSGPSLDRRIDFLKKYADKAVIISCGTAIRTLEKEGIFPDFHVELERTKPTYDILRKTVSPEFLKQLIIVAPNTIYHEFFDLGKKAFMFLKANDAGAALFPKGFPWLYCCNPTVTNTGLSFAIYSGFKNIVLVGVDFGTTDPKVHHSLKSAYYDEKSPIAGRGGNFDIVVEEPHGKIYTNSLLMWSKKTMEMLIQKSKVNVFNLSEGLSIFGSLRRKPEQFNFSSQGKTEAIKNIMSSLDYDYWKTNIIERSFRSMFKESKAFLKIAKDMLKISSFTRRIVIDRLCQLHKFIFQELIKRHFGTFMLYKGSFLQFSNIIFLYSYMIPNHSEREKFLREGIDLFLEFLQRGHRNLEGLYKAYYKGDKLFELQLNKSYFLILD